MQDSSINATLRAGSVVPRRTIQRLAATAMLTLAVHACAAPTAEIRVECDRPTVSLAPHLYGLFFEDINHAADGGLYAELVRNRSFEFLSRGDYHPLYAWEKVERGGARVDAEVVDNRPVHRNNAHYLRLAVTRPGVAGISNAGFFGLPTDADARYNVSLYARISDWRGDAAITVALESGDGSIAGSVRLSGVGETWTLLKGELTATRTLDEGRLVVTTTGQGTLELDMVSLFPQDTWMGRRNGLRKDLVQALQDLHPAFLRFPGGCIAHGDGLDNMYRWKDSVGDIAERKPNWNLWGYHQTYGLGYFEYFQLCEDLNMAALPVIPVGVSCGFRGLEVVAMDELEPHIQDALDLIEFANGSATSRWGSVRAKMGHPEPFGLEFVCLGNEEHDTPAVRERFPLFVEAIRAAHPEIKIIGTSGLGAGIPLYDLMTDQAVYSSDEHYYEAPEWFIRNQYRFDTFDRSKPKIFLGEYASRGSTLFNAVAEAAYLTGVERNGDIVDMTCYAPLFGRQGHTQWNPDLIYFDPRRVLLTPNYYVQQLFAQNKGDVYLANEVEPMAGLQPRTPSGRIGIGTWNTAIEVESITVNGRTVDPASWQVQTGEFALQDGRYVQTNDRIEGAMSLSPESVEGDTVTYSLRARKTRGAEGFLVRFGADENGRGGYWLNLGGWGNTRHAIEAFVGGGKAEMINAPGSIEEGRWYDVKVVLGPGLIQCFLDEEQVLNFPVTPPPLSVSSTYDRSAGEIVLKLVNANPEPVRTRVRLAGATRVAPEARLISLSGDAAAVNTFENPSTVIPVTNAIPVGSEFDHTVPATSVQCIRIPAEL